MSTNTQLTTKPVNKYTTDNWDIV